LKVKEWDSSPSSLENGNRHAEDFCCKSLTGVSGYGSKRKSETSNEKRNPIENQT